MDSTHVGMIGLGLMGTAMAERLLEAGYGVHIWNRTREKAAPLLARGAHWADNPPAVCERVIISLYTTETVEEVLRGMDGGLGSGRILIDTTTGELEQTFRLGERLAARGVQYLDAPISGSSEQTRRGEAVVKLSAFRGAITAKPAVTPSLRCSVGERDDRLLVTFCGGDKQGAGGLAWKTGRCGQTRWQGALQEPVVALWCSFPT